MAKIEKRLKVHAQRSDYNRRVDFWFYAAGEDGDAIAEPLVFGPPTDEPVVKEPTISLLPQQAQDLMDALWSCGLRPTEGSGSAGSLSATHAHLKDMQKIAFHFIDKQ